jgi:sn-glycerol 3-phosphate transport system permease protein
MANVSTDATSGQPIQPLSRGPFGLTGPQRREIKTFLKALLYLSPALIIFAAFVFIPLVQSIRLSAFLTDPLGRPARFVGLLQYERLFANDLFVNSLQRSVLFVLYTVPTTLIVAMLLALLGNLRLRRIDVFRMIFSITIAVSGATAALIFSYLYSPSLGWFNYLLSLVGIDPVPWLISERTALPAVAFHHCLAAIRTQHGHSARGYAGHPRGVIRERDDRRRVLLVEVSPYYAAAAFADALLPAYRQHAGRVPDLHADPHHDHRAGRSIRPTCSSSRSTASFTSTASTAFAAAQSIMLFLIILALTIVQFGVVEKRVHYD